MNAQDQEILMHVLKTLEMAIKKVWVREAILDQSQIPNWRQTAQDAEEGIAADVHAQVRPLYDAILGLSALTPEDAVLVDWHEDVRKLLDSAFEE